MNTEKEKTASANCPERSATFSVVKFETKKTEEITVNIPCFIKYGNTVFKVFSPEHCIMLSETSVDFWKASFPFQFNYVESSESEFTDLAAKVITMLNDHLKPSESLKEVKATSDIGTFLSEASKTTHKAEERTVNAK